MWDPKGILCGSSSWSPIIVLSIIPGTSLYKLHITSLKSLSTLSWVEAFPYTQSKIDTSLDNCPYNGVSGSVHWAEAAVCSEDARAFVSLMDSIYVASHLCRKPSTSRLVYNSTTVVMWYNKASSAL